MLTINQQESVSQWFYDQYREIESEGLELIAKHLGNMRGLSTVNFSKLEQIAIMNGNINDIDKKLADLMGTITSEVEKQLTNIAREQYLDSSKFYTANGVEQLSFADNVAVINLLASVSDRVTEELYNLSHTTVFEVQYRQSIDKAILALAQGETDVQTAFRKIIRENSQKGMQTDPYYTDKVQYLSGNFRRLDTAVRMNVLEGLHQVNQGVALITGQEFGADGVEITSHSNPAPDHIHIDGIAMTNKAYESFQKSAKRPCGELGCKHFAFPIVTAISRKKVYDESGLTARESQRQSMVDSLEKFSWVDSDGMTHDKTMYEWTQVMRALETKGRYTNDLRRGAIAINDQGLASQARRDKKAYLAQYNSIIESINGQGQILDSEWKRRAN